MLKHSDGARAYDGRFFLYFHFMHFVIDFMTFFTIMNL